MTKTIATLAAAAMLLGVASAASAAPKSTNPDNLPPGQAKKTLKPVPGAPGASGYTPGHQMNSGVTSPGGAPGASGFAPGHAPSTTSSTTRTR
jgi:Spy/CpxP family protein refolding chaperone